MFDIVGNHSLFINPFRDPVNPFFIKLKKFLILPNLGLGRGLALERDALIFKVTYVNFSIYSRRISLG